MTRAVTAVLALAILPLALGDPKIGFLLKGRTDFWSEVEKGAQAAANAANVELLVKAPPTEDNVGVQIRLLEALAAENVSVLIIAPSESKALAAPVAALAKRGIKVIVVDSPVASDQVASFVRTDQEAAGAAAGEFMAGFVQASDEVAFFKASETQTGGATEQRENGAASALRSRLPSVTIQGRFHSGSDPEIATARAVQLLEQYPGVKAVFASSTVGTLSALHALQKKNRATQIKLIGFGYNLIPEAEQALRTGEMTAWIAQLPREVGRKAVETAVTLAHGGTVPAVVHVRHLLITKDSLASAEVRALSSK